MREGKTKHAVEIAGRTFAADLPALVCPKCGEALVAGDVLERFELHVARALADAGDVSGESFRYMRRALGLSGKAIAEELGTAPETISRWEREHGANGPDRFAWFALASLVHDAVDGRAGARDLLRAMRERPGLAKSVRLEVDAPKHVAR